MKRAPASRARVAHGAHQPLAHVVGSHAGREHGRVQSRARAACPGDRPEQREAGDGPVARDHHGAVLRIVPALGERQHLERAIDVRRDAQRPHAAAPAFPGCLRGAAGAGSSAK